MAKKAAKKQAGEQGAGFKPPLFKHSGGGYAYHPEVAPPADPREPRAKPGAPTLGKERRVGVSSSIDPRVVKLLEARPGRSLSVKVNDALVEFFGLKP